MKKILLTGGLGYIGSHIAEELLHKEYEVVIIDDLSNSEKFVFEKIESVSPGAVHFIEGDIRNTTLLDNLFQSHNIDGIIHLAAKKAVGESVKKPLQYYDVNVGGLINLLKTSEQYNIRKFIFSSSCTVYGKPDKLPVTEETPFGETPSPYGKTKQICEYILKDYSQITDMNIVSLRYFNPAGASKSGKLGELPKGVPNNLVPFLTQTVAGIRDSLKVFGSDYKTLDGTAIRDYIHVVDLAQAHVKALESNTGKYDVFNIGTGKGYSILEVIESFQKVNELDVPYELADRRPGDLPVIYGEVTKAKENLNWVARNDIDDMMMDAWKWEMQHKLKNK